MHKLVTLSLVVLSGMCAACSSTSSGYYVPWSNWFSPAPRTYYSSYSSTRYSSSRTRHHAREERYRVAHNRSPARNSAVKTVSTDSEDGVRPDTVVPVMASAPPVTLSLAGDSMDRAQAEHLLEVVDTKLERAHGRHLSQAEKETYERASQLAGRARQALTDNDCAAASSLAAKASSLAAGLHGSEL